MNYLKRIIVIIALCCLIGVIISAFLPSELELNKTTIIDADKEVVQKQLSFFKYQKIANYTLEAEIWELNEIDNGLEIISTVKFNFGFNPINKFYALFDEEKIIEILQFKFDSIKLVLEELPKIKRVDVQKIKIEKDIWFLSIRDTINPREMNNLHGKFYDEINRYLITQNLSTTEPPLVIYHFWSDTIVDIEVGVQVVDSTIIGNDNIKMNKIKASNVVTAIHYGAYERLPETYFGINEWMRKNKVAVTGPPWEIYLTDPATEANPKKWETAIFFPIK